MAHPSIPRSLWHETVDGSRTIDQASLLKQGRPMVILGEPGMGKTELLLWLGAQPGYSYCTARKLLNIRPGPQALLQDASVLVIDALDELSARAEGDAVDLVLQKLGDAGYPTFVLACRVADWRSATAPSAIAEMYPSAQPLVLHLEPLTDQEALRIVLAELDGDVDLAVAVMDHFERLKLGGLLSNPQTLELVTRVAKVGKLPETKARLFDDAVDLLRKEHNVARSGQQPDKESSLDAAGAAFAALILTGSEALVIDSVEPGDGELLDVEVAALPGASALAATLGSRLFGTAGAANQFRYWHRRIGEYLGARWLARQATTPMQRRRILTLFHAHQVVPASLRGLHAWLAHHSPSLAEDVITADVAAFVDYGEADTLGVAQARVLLSALKDLAARDPNLYLGSNPTAKALMQPALLEDVRALIRDSSAAFFLRYLLVLNVKGSAIAEPLRGDARDLMLDAAAGFALRKTAVDVLIELGGEDWKSILDALRRTITEEEGIRLALEIIQEVGVDAFGPRMVIEFVVAQARRQERVVGLLGKLGGGVSDASLDGLLDELANQVHPPSEPEPGKAAANGVLTDFAGHLISRRLLLGNLDPARVWSWLQAFEPQYGYEQSPLVSINERLKENAPLRRTIQRIVLLDESGERSFGTRAFRLRKASLGLLPDEDDVLALLASLDPAKRSDLRWRQVLTSIRHDDGRGARAREAAGAFAAHRPDLLAWIERLGSVRPSRFDIREQKLKRRAEAKRQMENLESRRHFEAHIESLREGAYSEVYPTAVVFLGKASDVKKEGEPLERLGAWLGPALAAAAFEGFEAFIQSDEPPSAHQVAQSNAEGMSWESRIVIVAAVLARFLDGRGFAGVNDDRLQAAYWLLSGFGESVVGKEVLPAVEAELRRRGCINDAVRLWMEPQFQLNLAHPTNLHRFLWSVLDEVSAIDFSLDWLSRFPDMAAVPEMQIIDRVLFHVLPDRLRPLVQQRLTQDLSVDRRLGWDAVAFVVDFDAQRGRLENGGTVDRNLIWWVRGRLKTDRSQRSNVPLSVAQRAWLISTFRGIYPFVSRPAGVTRGDQNPWDASRFLSSIAERLADETSSVATAALTELAAAPRDDYTPDLLSLLAEHRRKLAEQQYRPSTLEEIRAIATAEPARSVADLQAMMLELLDHVQKRIYADHADPWRGFYTDARTPRPEERCRDHLLTMLGYRPESIDLDPEVHAAADKRVDICATLPGMRLPIEIKGQWHDSLWTAADAQLDALYATDHAADHRGIYLVLWFGHKVPKTHVPKSRPGGSKPQFAEALRRDLIKTSRAAQSGRISVVVLDIERTW